jgi:1,4-alpha-glucan branching enzyme
MNYSFFRLALFRSSSNMRSSCGLTLATRLFSRSPKLTRYRATASPPVLARAFVALFLLVNGAAGLGAQALGQEIAWLEGNPDAIWSRSPGFYRDSDAWYAIIHVKPNVTRVQLAGEFTNGSNNAIDLTKTPDGKFWWLKRVDSEFSRAPRAGDKYWFIQHFDNGGKAETQDPAARRVENSSLSARSIATVSSSYSWGDANWRRPGWEYYLIYQLHPRRFTARNPGLNPFQQIIEEVNNNGQNDYLNKVGATAIQLMPVNEFPGDLSWGYNPSFFYAIESSYGTPDQLKQVVDMAHRNGKAVILDLVYNHGSSDDNILWNIAQFDQEHGTYYDGDTVWGPLVNFDNDVARHFFVQNIVYLAREYHIDGFRFDFTRPIHNASDPNIRKRGTGGGWEFLREVREKIKAVDSRILLIAEELPNTWHVTAENVGSTWAGDSHGPFDAQWADEFHDKFKAVLTGGHLDNLKSAFVSFGDSWQDAVIYAESHDEVGNTDDRVAKRGRDGKGWEMSQIAAAGTILGRGSPMIFMGQEAGEWMQFGQDDGKLPAHTPGAYDPGTGSTWWDDFLDLNAYENGPDRSKLLLWYRKMFDIRRGDLSRLANGNVKIEHIHNDNGIAAFSRDQGKYVVVLNFKSRSWDNYDIGVRGRYQELANTSWPAFNLGNYPEKSRGGDTGHDITSVSIPAYGAVVLVRWD